MNLTLMNDVLLLILEKLPAQDLEICLRINKTWNSLTILVIRKRILGHSVDRVMPTFIGTETTELDILLKLESFLSTDLRTLWALPHDPVFEQKCKNINYVSEFQLDQDYYVKPTLLKNNKIVVFIEALDQDDCITLFLIDIKTDKMTLLPWRLYTDSVLVNAIHCRFFVVTNFDGNAFLYDPDTLEVASHLIKSGGSEIMVRGDLMVAQSSSLIPTQDVVNLNEITVYKIPDQIENELKEIWSIQSTEERYFDFNSRFLATLEQKESGECMVEVFYIQTGKLYQKIQVPNVSSDMFVSCFFLTRFHLVFYQRQYFPAPYQQEHQVNVIELKTMELQPTVNVQVEPMADSLMAIDLLYDESGIVSKTDENEMISCSFDGKKYSAKFDDTQDTTLGFWICLDGKPVYYKLPLPAIEIFRPMVNATELVNSKQVLKILSHRDGSIQATEPLRPSTTSFYEITIIRDSRSDSALAIGLATKGYAPFMLPGWQEQSVGYHSDDGRLFLSNGEQGITGSRPFVVGDVVEIGYHKKEEHLVVFYFKLNGEVLDHVIVDDFVEDLYPTIGADGDFEILVSFCKEYQGCFLSSPFLI